MRRVLPFLGLLVVGCARPEPFRANHDPAYKTADRRELELRKNLREGRNWTEQEQMMSDVKSAFTSGSMR